MFWQLPHHDPDSPLFLYKDDLITAGAFADVASPLKKQLQNYDRKTLGMIVCSNHPAAVTAYLSSLCERHAVMLTGADLHEDLRDALIEEYQPDWIFHPSDTAITGYAADTSIFGWSWHERLQTDKAPALHDDLAVLLSTSGSTGSPKMVRLSYNNLAANAASIAEYLKLTPEDRAITSLPMTYSYGLSVINSHLHVGASLYLTEASLMQPDFWKAMEHDITHLSGVASQYQMLQRLKLETRAPESLRIINQAGGKLDPEIVSHFATLAPDQGWEFFIMYGQTEATARMAYMPPESLAQNPDCIGVAIPGGTISTDDETGELIYEGPNVMMGYAERREDLAKGDEYGGVLRTGDIAEKNENGFWKITGRLKRFIKLSGQRIQLDQVEKYLSEAFSFSSLCTGEDEHLRVWIKSTESKDLADEVSGALFDRFGIHPTLMSVHFIDEIPLNANGKIDYQQLKPQEAA